MKRVLTAVISGLSLPLFYLILLIVLINIASFLFGFLGRDSLLHTWAEWVEPFVILPISWASYIYFYFYFIPPDNESILPDFALGNILSLIIGNFLLYGTLTYTILSLYNKASN